MSHEKPHSNSTNFTDDQDKEADEPPQEPPYGLNLLLLWFQLQFVILRRRICKKWTIWM